MPGDDVLAADLDQGVAEGLVNRGGCRILTGHPALPDGGPGQAREHVRNVFFGEAHPFTAIVAQYRLNGLGKPPIIDGPSRRRQGSFHVAGRPGLPT